MAVRRRLRNTVVLLVVAFLWLFVGEVAVYYSYSLQWHWPRLGLSVEYLDRHFFRHDVPRGATGGWGHRHYRHGDTHYYTGSRERIKDSLRASSLRVLLLSDPHVMCTFDKEELWIARKDADRYLSTTFYHLARKLDPDMIILLGDIFSDGFQASESQWGDYLTCLENIYSLSSFRSKFLLLYGDNDIGGEGRDKMTSKVLSRYVQTFGSLNENYNVSGVQFVKLTTVCFINIHPRTDEEMKCRRSLEDYVTEHRAAFKNSGSPRLVLSHVPLRDTAVTSPLKRLVLQLEPSYIFSGHIHHESYSTHVVQEGKKEGRLVHEITVPTCSYRMGEQYMGVGVAVIGSTGEMAYRVLWLPPRYPFLASYGVVLLLLILSLCYHCSYRCGSYR